VSGQVVKPVKMVDMVKCPTCGKQGRRWIEDFGWDLIGPFVRVKVWKCKWCRRRFNEFEAYNEIPHTPTWDEIKPWMW